MRRRLVLRGLEVVALLLAVLVAGSAVKLKDYLRGGSEVELFAHPSVPSNHSSCLRYTSLAR